MSCPEFKIDDKVLCEVSKDFSYQPRWDHGNDKGGSGSYMEGVVTSIHSAAATISVRFESISWSWPLPGHNNYNDNQWNRPGYLRKIVGNSTAQDNPDICVCETIAMMNLGCKCGSKQ